MTRHASMVVKEGDLKGRAQPKTLKKLEVLLSSNINIHAESTIHENQLQVKQVQLTKLKEWNFNVGNKYNLIYTMQQMRLRLPRCFKEN